MRQTPTCFGGNFSRRGYKVIKEEASRAFLLKVEKEPP